MQANSCAKETTTRGRRTAAATTAVTTGLSFLQDRCIEALTQQWDCINLYKEPHKSLIQQQPWAMAMKIYTVSLTKAKVVKQELQQKRSGILLQFEEGETRDGVLKSLQHHQEMTATELPSTTLQERCIRALAQMWGCVDFDDHDDDDDDSDGGDGGDDGDEDVDNNIGDNPYNTNKKNNKASSLLLAASLLYTAAKFDWCRLMQECNYLHTWRQGQPFQVSVYSHDFGLVHTESMWERSAVCE
jgi:hypothetical protein